MTTTLDPQLALQVCQIVDPDAWRAFAHHEHPATGNRPVQVDGDNSPAELMAAVLVAITTGKPLVVTMRHDFMSPAYERLRMNERAAHAAQLARQHGHRAMATWGFDEQSVSLRFVAMAVA